MKNLKIIFSAFLSVLLALGWVSYVVSSSKDLVEYKENLQKAEEWTQQGLYYRAVDCYDEAIKYKSTEKNWENLISVCELNYEEYPDFLDDYIDYLDKAATAYPKNVSFVYSLAMAYYDDESYKSAYNVARTAVDNGVKDEKILTLERNLRYVYQLKGSTFSEFYSPIDDVYSVHGSSGWGSMEIDGKADDSWDKLYYGPIGEDGERVIKDDLGVRLYDKDDKVLAKFDDNIVSAGRFSEELIAVEYAEGKYAYYDEYGEKKFGDYEYAGTFNDGQAAVKQNGKWGIIDKNGETVVDFKFDDIVLDGCGYFNKQGIVIAAENGKYHIYDTSLSQKNDFEAEKIGVPTSDKKLAFCQSGKWGFVDFDGKVLIEPAYEGALSFSNSLAGVCSGGKWGFIDNDGNIVIECTYAGVDYFTEEGTCCVRVDAPELEDSPAEWQLLVLELGIQED